MCIRDRSSGSPVHVIGSLDAEQIYLTEGALKGTIAHYLSGDTFICVAGVNQYRNLKPVLETLKSRHLQHLYAVSYTHLDVYKRQHDYCVLDMHTIFNMTSDYLKAHFKGSTYREGSGSFDHSIVSAMWTLGGNQELLDTYHQALELSLIHI